MYKQIGKRIIDFCAALFGLVVLSPILVGIAIALFFTNSGKPFFFQKRPGKNGRIFGIVKFKTMSDKRDANGKLLPDHDRITKLGNFIRKTSLDEIPQLINVLKGDMSLIGPRPLLPEYLPLYNAVQARRHDVKPGITGWAQVNGRNAISWAQKFELDIHYVNNYSFSLDIMIVYLTFIKVFKREGINVSDKSTMTAFNGEN